jgi:hypothetical protein
LPALARDFNEINEILASLEADVEREICALSPWIDKLDHVDLKARRVIANFSIDKARACSWRAAQRLASLSCADLDDAIVEIDAEIAILARLIERPVGVLIDLNLLLVRFRETWDVRKVIKTLSGKPM